jgi:pre-mRNA-splicing helicase BRR2
VEVYTLSLKERTKLKGLLEVVSSSAEFESIPIRRHEDVLLRRIYDRVPVKLDRTDFEAPHFKTFLLLQAHFSRLQLPPDLAADQVLVLEKVLNLLSACVDVMSSNAWLNALGAMDLSQMCVQAMWETESPLKQIPHFDSDVSQSYPMLHQPHRYSISRLSRGARRPELTPYTTSWRWKTRTAINFSK